MESDGDLELASFVMRWSRSGLSHRGKEGSGSGEDGGLHVDRNVLERVWMRTFEYRGTGGILRNSEERVLVR